MEALYMRYVYIFFKKKIYIYIYIHTFYLFTYTLHVEVYIYIYVHIHICIRTYIKIIFTFIYVRLYFHITYIYACIHGYSSYITALSGVLVLFSQVKSVEKGRYQKLGPSARLSFMFFFQILDVQSNSAGTLGYSPLE